MRTAMVPALALLAYAVASCSGADNEGATGPPEEIPVDAFEYTLELPLESTFGLVRYEPGPVGFVLANLGEEDHELQVLRLDEDRTLEDAFDLVDDETAPPDWVTVEGTATAAPGENSDRVAVDLVEGLYLLACFLQTDDGVSHASLGMNKPFRVE